MLGKLLSISGKPWAHFTKIKDSNWEMSRTKVVNSWQASIQGAALMLPDTIEPTTFLPITMVVNRQLSSEVPLRQAKNLSV